MCEIAALGLCACGPWLDVGGTEELLGKLAPTKRTGAGRIREEVPAQRPLLYAALPWGNEVERTFG